jgi:hypothetical protein
MLFLMKMSSRFLAFIQMQELASAMKFLFFLLTYSHTHLIKGENNWMIKCLILLTHVIMKLLQRTGVQQAVEIFRTRQMHQIRVANWAMSHLWPGLHLHTPRIRLQLHTPRIRLPLRQPILLVLIP